MAQSKKSSLVATVQNLKAKETRQAIPYGRTKSKQESMELAIAARKAECHRSNK